jgi:alpha-glucosidase (family GH31 glycosyl hydrolase)
VVSANNVFDSIAAPNSWFQVGAMMSLTQWRALVNDTTSVAQSIPFPDPTRTIATYHASIGGTPTLQAFMAGARLQSKSNWRVQYTAQAVNDYIRAGFGL